MASIRSVGRLIICLVVAVASAQQPTVKTEPSAPSNENAPQNELTNLNLTDLQRRAEAGDGKAQNELAFRYRLGSGGAEKDATKSAEWLHKAAAAGIPMAYFNLGVTYYNGDGVAIDDKQSCKWFMLANDAGVGQARDAAQRAKETLSPARFLDCELLVAKAYLEGREIARDYSKAIEMYRHLAAEGNGEASERLAVMYDHGWGVPSDAKQSVSWLELGAEQGNSLAQYELGRIYEIGINATQDYSRALKLYQASANHAFIPALLALSKMYMDGRGVKPNPQTALMWALLAADRRSHEAKTLVDTIGAQLSKKEIQAAKKEALLHKAAEVRLTYAP